MPIQKKSMPAITNKHDTESLNVSFLLERDTGYGAKGSREFLEFVRYQSPQKQMTNRLHMLDYQKLLVYTS